MRSLFEIEIITIKPILRLGNDILREKFSLVEDFQSRELGSFIEDLSDTLSEAKIRFDYDRGIVAP